MPTGKQPGGACQEQQAPPIPPISPQDPEIVMVVAVKVKSAVDWERWETAQCMELMLDSGATVSLVHQEVQSQAQGTTHIEVPRQLRLVTASEDHLPVRVHVQDTIQLRELEFMHTLVAVCKLVAPVILGVDFCMQMVSF